MAKEGHVYSDPIHQSEQDSINPGFYRPSGASSDLNSLENGAAKQGYGRTSDDNSGADATSEQQSNSPLAQISQAENSIKSNVKGAAITAATGGKIKGAKAKKMGPLALILFILLGGGAFFIGSQSGSFLGMVNNIIEEMNTSNPMLNRRANRLLIKHMSKGDTPDYTKKKLAAQGIEVKKDKNTKQEYLEFEDADGKKQKVTSDNFKEHYKNNATFRNKYTVASATWRGQSSGWFTKLTSTTLKRIGVSRDNFREHDESKTAKDDEATKRKKLKEDIDKAGPKTDDNGKIRGKDAGEDEDTNRKQVSNDSVDSDSSAVTKKDGPDGVKAKISKKVAGMGGAANIAAGGCVVYSVANTIRTVVIAAQKAEMLKMASTFLEASQKVQAGEGKGSPIHTYMNTLTEVDPNTKKTAMQSAGVAALFSGSSGSQYKDNASVKLANSNSVVTEALSAAMGPGEIFVNGGPSLYNQCIAINAGASLLNLITTPLGVFKIAAAAIIGMGATIFADLAINAIVESATKAIAKDVVKDMFGEDLGNYIVSGAQMELGTVHQGMGGAVGTKAMAHAQHLEQQQVIAEQAEFERSTLSPFDTSSQYTFFGSIAQNLAALSTTSNGNILTTAGNIVTSSMANLIPGASAANMTDRMQTEGDCPDLNGIGATCDMFGNPWFVSDFSLIDEDPEDVAKKVESLKPNGNYEKYQKYCEQRDTPFGIADPNIISDLTGNSDLKTFLSGTPIVGDLLGLGDAAIEAANADWITGKNCVADSSSTFWQNEGRWYQLYDEDQELKAQMNGEFATNGGGDNNASGDISAFQAKVKELAWEDGVERTEQKSAYTELMRTSQYTGDCNGNDCGAFVYNLITSSGWDKDYAAGNTDTQYNYMKSHWTEIHPSSEADLQPGDVMIQGNNANASNTGHVAIYVGDISGFSGKYAAASQCDYAPKASQNLFNDNYYTYKWWFRKTSSSSSTSSLDNYSASKIIAYNPGETIYNDESDTTIATTDNEYDNYLAQIARLSGLSINEVSEVLDLLNTSTGSNSSTTGQIDLYLTSPISSINFTPSSNTPLRTAAAGTTNQSYISATHIVYAPTRTATTTI